MITKEMQGEKEIREFAMRARAMLYEKTLEYLSGKIKESDYKYDRGYAFGVLATFGFMFGAETPEETLALLDNANTIHSGV